MVSDPKLEPCPKCKTDSEVQIEVGHSPFTPHTLVRVRCEKCGFAGDAKKSLPEAVAAWNSRNGDKPEAEGGAE